MALNHHPAPTLPPVVVGEPVGKEGPMGPRGFPGERGAQGPPGPAVGIRVADYGTAADGITDDSAAITTAATTAVAAGMPLVFDGSKRYALNAGIVFPANLTVQTNGAIFVKTNTSTTYAIRTGERFTADSIRLEVSGSTSSNTGVWVSGSHTRIDAVTVTALGVDQTGVNALFIGDETPLRENIVVGTVTVTGFRSPVRVKNITRSRFDAGTITNFITGVYIIDVTDTHFGPFHITGTSPSSTGGAGQNGLLIEAQATDYSVNNLTFTGWMVDGAPEHGYRIGGSLICANIIHDKCISRNSGNAPGATATGGAGFKVLGVIDHIHRNIRYVNCESEDGGIANGINNFAQFHFGFVDGLTAINPVVKTRTKQYASQIGMLFNGVSNAEIINPSIRNVFRQAVLFLTDSTNTSLTPNTNIRINGGYVDTSGNSYGVHFDTRDGSTTNIFLDRVTVSRGSLALRTENPTNAGNYTNVHAVIRYINAPTSSTTPPVGGGNLITLDYTGPVYGSFGMPSLDGGTYLNTAGQRYIRKGGAWVQQ